MTDQRGGVGEDQVNFSLTFTPFDHEEAQARCKVGAGGGGGSVCRSSTVAGTPPGGADGGRGSSRCGVCPSYWWL